MRRVSLPAISAFALLTLAACATGSGTAAPPATAPTSAAPAAAGGCAASSETAAVSVGIEGFAFSPPEVTAAVGETITWTNADTAGHTATMDDGACDTGTIAPNAMAGLVFDAAGSYSYHCAIHPTMTAKVTITE